MTVTSNFMIRGVLATALALGVSGPVVAAGDDSTAANEAQAAEEGGSTQGQGQMEVSQADLEKFAAAYGQIQQVRAEYGRKLQQTEDQAKREELKQEGQQEMIAAIEEEGLELSEYQQIGRRLNNDQELRSRLQQVMKKQQQQQQGSMSGESG